MNSFILIEYTIFREINTKALLKTLKTFLPIFKCCHKKCYEKVNVEKQGEFFDK
jgi:hypothetical protein